MQATERKSSLRASLAHRDFRLLLGAYAISRVGDWLYGVSLLVFVFDQTHSPGWVGATAILRLVPMALLGTFGGVMADRYERRRIMIIADLVRGGLMLALAVVVAFSGPVVIALVLAMLASAAATPYDPALAAMTPAVVPEEDLAAANASMSVTENLAVALGPALGGVLLYLGSSWLAFLINAATFVASAALVSLVRERSRAREEGEEKGLIERTLDGFRAAVQSSDAAIILFCIFMATTIYGQESVLFILVSKQLLGTGSSGAGFLFAATGVGGLLGAALTGPLARDSRPGRTLAFSMCLSGAALIGLSFVHWTALAYAFVTLDGIGYIILDVLAMTMLQRIVPSDLLARVFGIFMSLAVVGILVGAIVAPILNNLWGLRVALLAAGGSLPLSALLVTPKLREMNVRAQEKQEERAPIVAMLSGLGIFTGASPPALEGLAQSVAEQHVAAGTKVVQEGEEPDDFFVVSRGRFSVLARGEQGGSEKLIRTLESGDYFGEIGLLQKMPRTATVRADTDATIYRIGGEAFLEAVAEIPALSPTLMVGMAGRLAQTHPSYELKPA